MRTKYNLYISAPSKNYSSREIFVGRNYSSGEIFVTRRKIRHFPQTKFRPIRCIIISRNNSYYKLDYHHTDQLYHYMKSFFECVRGIIHRTTIGKTSFIHSHRVNVLENRYGRRDTCV